MRTWFGGNCFKEVHFGNGSQSICGIYLKFVPVSYPSFLLWHVYLHTNRVKECGNKSPQMCEFSGAGEQRCQEKKKKNKTMVAQGGEDFEKMGKSMDNG